MKFLLLLVALSAATSSAKHVRTVAENTPAVAETVETVETVNNEAAVNNVMADDDDGRTTLNTNANTVVAATNAVNTVSTRHHATAPVPVYQPVTFVPAYMVNGRTTEETNNVVVANTQPQTAVQFIPVDQRLIQAGFGGQAGIPGLGGVSAGVGTGYGNNLLSGGFSAGLGSGYPAKPGHSYYYSPTYPYSTSTYGNSYYSGDYTTTSSPYYDYNFARQAPVHVVPQPLVHQQPHQFVTHPRQLVFPAPHNQQLVHPRQLVHQVPNYVRNVVPTYHYVA